MKTTVKQTLMIIGGSLLAVGGVGLAGYGIYKRGQSDWIDTFTHIVFEEGKEDFDLFDKSGRLYCIATEYLGD